MTPNRREFEKQCAFQKFCKSVLHNEACNAH
ncbi:RNA polymerase subunit sigma, partial [Clostridioides difficile]